MGRHKKQQMVTVIGNIGSGKTTVTPVVAKALKAKHVFADNLFQTIDPFRQLYLEDIKRWALCNELWLTLERVILVKKYLKTQKNKLLVVDSGLLMSWAYAHGHTLGGNMTENEWNLYRGLFDKIAVDLFASSVVVSLDLPVESLLKRIKKRGRKFELKYYTPNYLSQIDTGLQKLREKLKRKKIKVIALNEEDVIMNSKGQVEMDEALKKIKRLV